MRSLYQVMAQWISLAGCTTIKFRGCGNVQTRVFAHVLGLRMSKLSEIGLAVVLLAATAYAGFIIGIALYVR